MKYALLSVSVSYLPTCEVRDQTRTPKKLQRRACTCRCALRAQSTYSELTEPSSRMRRIVSASSSATDSCRIGPALFAAALNGMVSVTTSSSSAERARRGRVSCDPPPPGDAAGQGGEQKHFPPGLVKKPLDLIGVQIDRQ